MANICLFVLLLSASTLILTLGYAGPLALKTFLTTRIVRCPCIVQWGGYASNPAGLVIGITRSAKLSDAHSLLLPYTPRPSFVYSGIVPLRGFCRSTHVNDSGDFELTARGRVHEYFKDLNLYHIWRNKCDPHSINVDDNIELQEDCSSDMGSYLRKDLQKPFGNAVNVPTTQRVVNGFPITDEELAKYNVLITSEDKEVHCSGSLIAPMWVLTAAHCNVPEGSYVIIGLYKNSDGKLIQGEHVKVISEIKHPDYDEGTFHIWRDIKLLKLDRDVDHADDHITYVNTDCDRPKPCQWARISGYGLSCRASEGEHIPWKDSTLRAAKVHIIDDEKCDELLHRMKLDDISQSLKKAPHVCARHDICGSGTCYGDSGGPLVVQVNRQDSKDHHTNVQVGIISHHLDGCGTKDEPDIYTGVAGHAEWISDMTGGLARMDPPMEERKYVKCMAKVEDDTANIAVAPKNRVRVNDDMGGPGNR